MREAAALDMTDADVLGALCGSLLRCRQWRLARKYLGGTASTPLPASAAEALVLGRARELLSSAATLGSPEVAEVRLMALTHNPGHDICMHYRRCHFHVTHATSIAPVVAALLQQALH